MRQEFLHENWAPYPNASQGWIDAADSRLRSPGNHLVGGRLKAEKGTGSCLLSSGGGEIRFSWASQVEWLAKQRKPLAFSPDLLADGDLILVRLTVDAATGPVATGVLLLAPALEAPVEPVFTVDRSRRWADYLSFIRRFFGDRGFIEATTPTLVPSPGTEPFLDPFATEWHFGSIRHEYFLPTSPEFHLKKMLARGWTKVFELKPCFRNGEISEHHQPEFTMLEWYRAYSDLAAIADDVEALLAGLMGRFAAGGLADAMRPRLERVTMAELFRRKLGFQLKAETSLDELRRLAQAHQIEFTVGDSWDDVFFRIFLEKIEPGLGDEGPLLVRGYPPSQAALSRIGGDGFADRFEVYWKGLELANAFHELNDPAENEKRFLDDAAKKRALGKRPVPVDHELLRDLRSGMPPSGGIALGVDRLFMALFELATIDEARAFPIQRPY